MPRPDLQRIPAYYHKYIGQVIEDDLMIALKDQTGNFVRFLESIPENKWDYAYAEGKWTIKDVLQHVIDGERVFAYRCLRFARKDSTPLPGFDENLYALEAKAGKRDWNDLIEEFKTVRKSSIWMFRSFGEEELNAEGVANGEKNYVLGFGFILVGHTLHHMKVIKEKYL
jgi:hypothetical protein